ncbi:hypothetical protein ACTMTF_15330 [Nonomuraea sp. ZG12]|uniref:hypothetical protein n=1 Tax=Nonomuraea sp. ZG12 TaxID=3452207 RepID=UPI003F89D332
MTVSPDYCWSCYKDEPFPTTGGVYIVCFECGHIYVTEQDLVDAYNLEIQEINRQSARERADGFEHLYSSGLPELPMKTSGDSIRFCQHCLHDF